MTIDDLGGFWAGGAPVVLHLTDANTVNIPDGGLLFGADFQRAGPDLVLSNPGALDVLIVDYFRSAEPADLVAPEGGVIAGHLVELLAGPLAPGQYAQAGGVPEGGDPIGQVETVSGGARVQRTDGSLEDLTVGTKIFLNDVVQTSDSGVLSVTFVDGTIFTLSESSRMVVDELVYTAGSNDNSATFNLIQGGFVFIAGQVAGSGGMDVGTPAATMGIRGTTVHVELDLSGSEAIAEITLREDFQGGWGRVEVFNLDRELVAEIDEIGQKLVIGANRPPQVAELTTQDEVVDGLLVDQAFTALQLALDRVELGGNFVQLHRAFRNGQAGEGQNGNGIELDGQDAESLEFTPPGRQDTESEEIQNQTDPDPFDEGLLDIIQRNFALSGPEDPPEGAPIAGRLANRPVENSLTLVKDVDNGALTLNPDGSFSYTPNPNFNGTDSFSYSFTNAADQIEEGTVVIRVLPVNDAPVMPGAAAAQVAEDGAVSGQATASDVDGDPLSFFLTTPAAHGAVSVAANGAWTYTPDPDFEGADAFVIGVEDGQGGTAEQTINLTVLAESDAPVITSDPAQSEATLSEDDVVAAEGQLTATDADAGAVLTWSGSTAGAFGTFAISTSGAWSYTLGADAQTLAAGDVAEEQFLATVTDETGASANQFVNITITGENDGPVVTSAPGDAASAFTENEATSVSGQLAASDIDIGPDPTWSGGGTGPYGTFSITGGGFWTFLADPAAMEALTGGQVVEQQFTATVTDDPGATATQLVTVTITGANDGPVITSSATDAAGAVTENDSPATGGKLTATDADAGETPQWTGNAGGVYGNFAIAADGTWSYALTAAAEALAGGQVVQEQFTATATDPGGAMATQLVTVTVTGTNDTPIVTSTAGDAAGAVTENTAPATGGALTATDADAGQDPTWSGSAAGTYGDFTIGADGVWTYTLNGAAEALAGGQVVQEKFTATASDGVGGAVDQIVAVTLTGTNDVPVITSTVEDASGAVTENTAPATGGTLTATDADAGQDPAWSGSAAGTYGDFAIGANGVWTYSLNAAAEALAGGEVVQEQFTATASDGVGGSVQQIVTVTVTGTNDVPVVTSDAGDASGAVTENTAPATGGTLTATDADAGQDPTWSGAAAGTYGDFAIGANGVWSYTLNAAAEALTQGQVVQEQFTATASDGVGGTVDQIVTITVTGTNDAPIVTSDATQAAGSIIEDTVMSATGKLSASDADLGAILEWTGSDTGTYGSFVIGTDGAWTYTAGAAVQALNAGDIVTDSFTATVTDDKGATATETVTITITGTNDGPTITSDPSEAQGAVTENTAPADSGQLTADDADGAATLTWSGSASGTYGTFTIGTDGAWTYALGAAAETLDPGEVVTENFVATVTDDLGASSGVLVTVTVTGTNDDPVVTSSASDAQGAVTEDIAPATGGTLTASDIDDGAVKTWSGDASGTYGDFAITAGGDWTYTLGAAAQALNPGQVVQEQFTAAVSDGQGGSATQIVTVTITGNNDAPVVTSSAADASGDVTENTAPAANGTLDADDADAGAAIAWSGSAAGVYGTFAIETDGTWSYTLGAAAEALGAGEVVQEQFTATVVDGQGGSATETVTITVTGTNDAPFVTSDAGAAQGAVTEDADPQTGGTLTADDADDSAVLTWSGSATGTYGTFFITAAGVWTYTLLAAAQALKAGEVVQEQFTATVTDDKNAADTQLVTVTLTGTNDVPVISTAPGGNLGAPVENTTPQVSGQLQATDADDDAVLIWSGSDTSTYGSFAIAGDGSWTYTLGAAAEALSAGQQVIEQFLATVTDENGATATQFVTITVTGTNDVAQVERVEYELLEGTSLTDTLSATDIDLADTLSFSMGPDGPDSGTVQINTDGSFTYTPDAGFVGIDGFDYKVNDGTDESNIGRVLLVVESESGIGGEGQEVTLNIYPDPDLGPAGSVVTTSSAGSSTGINLVIALHRSTVVEEAEFQAQLLAVADALTALQAEFAGAANTVTVHLLSYADATVVEATMNLDDPLLIETVEGVQYTGGGNGWEGVFAQTKTYLDTQDPTDVNFLYFITDGVQIVNGWRDDLEALTDSAANGYTVDISAFGIGTSKNFGTIRNVDPDAVLLQSAAELTDAFTATPLFSAQLISLSVTLIADDVDMGQIADETTGAIVSDGFETTLALADIAGIADMLGEENRISALAGFDLDGDTNTAEIELFSSEVFEKQDTDQTIQGVAGSDLLFGSDLGDTLDGNGGNDIILGFGGDDTLTTGTGIDTVFAGAGDDVIIIDSADAPADGQTERLDGGAGRDVAKFTFAGDLSDYMPGVSAPLADLSGIEAIDMTNNAVNTLALTLEDLQLLSGEADTDLETLLAEALPDSATIYGDTGDTVTLNETAGVDFAATGETVVDGAGNSLEIYTASSGGSVVATLAIDSDVTVVEQAAPVG